jgi:hypothetical protein
MKSLLDILFLNDDVVTIVNQTQGAISYQRP